jgi:hypothetical protein
MKIKPRNLMRRLEAFLSAIASPFVLMFATTQAKIGYGTLLKVGDGASPEQFVTVAEVRSVGNFGSERALIDVTNFDSPNTFMEYILAMKDGVEMAIQANFLPNNATQDLTDGLMSLQDAGTPANFKLILPGAFGTFLFAALVRKFEVPSIAPNAAMEITFTLKITGAISYSA